MNKIEMLNQLLELNYITEDVHRFVLAALENPGTKLFMSKKMSFSKERDMVLETLNYLQIPMYMHGEEELLGTELYCIKLAT